jgi:hypothetical protein
MFIGDKIETNTPYFYRLLSNNDTLLSPSLDTPEVNDSSGFTQQQHQQQQQCPESGSKSRSHNHRTNNKSNRIQRRKVSRRN